MAKKEKNFSYDKSIEEVQKILEVLQSSDYTSVDELVKYVDKAMGLIERCREELGEVKKKIDNRLA